MNSLKDHLMVLPGLAAVGICVNQGVALLSGEEGVDLVPTAAVVAGALQVFVIEYRRQEGGNFEKKLINATISGVHVFAGALAVKCLLRGELLGASVMGVTSFFSSWAFQCVLQRHEGRLQALS